MRPRTNTQGSQTVLEICNTRAHILVHTCVTERAWKVGYICHWGGTVVWGCTSGGVYVRCMYLHASWVTIGDPDLCCICVTYFEHWLTLIQGPMTGLQLEIDESVIWSYCANTKQAFQFQATVSVSHKRVTSMTAGRSSPWIPTDTLISMCWGRSATAIGKQCPA